MAPVKSPDRQRLEWASDIQKAAFEYGPYPQLGAGPFGGGKTKVFCRKALWLSDTFKNNRGVIARRVQKDLRATTMPTFFKECPPSAYNQGGRRNDSEGILQLNGGSEILWLYLDDPDLASIIRGLEINWFLIDQAEEAPDRMEANFDLMCSRLLRWEQAEVPQALIDRHGGDWPWKLPNGKPQPPPYAMLTANRDVKTHWLYRRFHPDSIEWQTKYKALGYRMFEMEAEDNRFLPEGNKEELRRQGAGSISVRKWGYPEGAIHQIQNASLLPGTQELRDYIRRNCTLHRFFSHGDALPTCCLWAAVDSQSNVYIYREYVKSHGVVSEHRQAITDLSRGERYELNQCKPQMFKAESKGARTTADEYADCLEMPRETALFWSTADDNELGTRNRINEYLALDPVHLHPLLKSKPAPHLYFVTATDVYPNGCVQIVQQTESQRRKKIGMDGGKATFSDDRLLSASEVYNCLRYMMASHAPKAMPAKRKAGPGTFGWHREKLRQNLSGRV